MRLLAIALLAASLPSLGCTSWLIREAEAVTEAVEPEPRYEALFGHYVEICAVSQYRSFEHGTGGVPGHAVMYLKGACLDETASVPALRPCRTVATTTADPEHGAGVSVNRWLDNANWVATPGHRLFFEGALEPGEPVERPAFDRTVRAAIDAGVFQGVVMRPDTPTQGSLEEVVGAQFLGTDFALRMARTVYCARLPVTDEMMGDVIDYLNAVNVEYAEGRADYRWSGLADNCAHLIHNALAAASVWRPRSVRVSRLRQLMNLSVPANEVIALARLGIEGPLADSREVYRDDEARDALLDFDWLPRRHGAVMTLLPVLAPNALFDTKSRIMVLQAPLTLGGTRTAQRIYQDPRFTRLRPNLEHFREVYAGILEEWDGELAGGFLPFRSARYLRPARRYYEYVVAQLAEVEAMLEQLDAAPAQPPAR